MPPSLPGLKTETRIARLDGIRALAVLLVFATHVEILPLGWIGVQLFFVLSGLFITNILRRSRSEASYWPPFYIRRATRILPPLAIAFLGAALFSNIPWRQVGFLEVFFLANVAETLHRGQTGTLGVLWSLAVEEQFYFAWPFAVRFLDRRHLLWLLTAILIGEPILRAAATPFCSTFWPIFFLTPFQLDGLAAGSLLALLLEDAQSAALIRRGSTWLFCASALLFAAFSFLPQFHREANSILFNSMGYSLINLCCCGLVAFVFSFESSPVSRVLAWPAVDFIGTISYGMYLFHPIILLLADRAGTVLHFHHNRILAPLTLLALILVSWLSFRFYEQPLISWGRKKASSLRRASQPAPVRP
jgi:peptidoglycan/LPS O-acetylase OafA/YrhL